MWLLWRSRLRRIPCARHVLHDAAFTFHVGHLVQARHAHVGVAREFHRVRERAPCFHDTRTKITAQVMQLQPLQTRYAHAGERERIAQVLLIGLFARAWLREDRRVVAYVQVVYARSQPLRHNVGHGHITVR